MILDKALACSLLYEWSLLIQIMYEMDIMEVLLGQSCFVVYIKNFVLENSSNLKEIGGTLSWMIL